MEVNKVKMAINGDDEAFLAIIHAHKADLYKTALSYLRNQDEAVEAIQEVTYRAYRSIHDLREPTYFKTWLIRIMINYCNDLLKKNNRLIFDERILLQLGKTEDYNYIEIEDAMSMLDDDQRQLLHLKYFQDIKIKEIAAIWNCPEGTVKTRLYKALGSLRYILEEKGEKKNV